MLMQHGFASHRSTFCCPQRAMNLSDAQKRSVCECRRRLMEDSEAARGRRAELWQQLGSRMVGDDWRTMERIAAVCEGRGHGLRLTVRVESNQQGVIVGFS